MENFRTVTYSENDRDIVRKGISGIAEILLGNDTERKLSMLFCLDWFMDPYYQQDINDIHDELIGLLQTVIVESNEDTVIEDAIDLLRGYEAPPFPIIEKNRNKIPLRFQDDISYLLDEKNFK